MSFRDIFECIPYEINKVEILLKVLILTFDKFLQQIISHSLLEASEDKYLKYLLSFKYFETEDEMDPLYITI